MLVYLRTEGKPYKNADELKKEWEQSFIDISSEDVSYTYKEFFDYGYYSDEEYIVDTETKQCYKEKDYFFKIMKQK